MRQFLLPMRVWDAPTRLFHWAIVVLVAAAWTTQEFDQMRWHMLCGYSILTLLLFRLVWGVIGSDTARFSRFLKSPVEAVRHLAHFRRREPDTEIGHNAAGGWMVLVMLALLLVQAGTGLFANDDIDTEGPLMYRVGKQTSDWLSHIHSFTFNLILAAIGLHVLAVFGYAVFKGHDLVRPMVTGKKRLPGAMRAPRMASPLLALVVFAACGVAVWALVTYGG
jgi:cytochrome b